MLTHSNFLHNAKRSFQYPFNSLLCLCFLIICEHVWQWGMRQILFQGNAVVQWPCFQTHIESWLIVLQWLLVYTRDGDKLLFWWIVVLSDPSKLTKHKYPPHELTKHEYISWFMAGSEKKADPSTPTACPSAPFPLSLSPPYLGCRNLHHCCCCRHHHHHHCHPQRPMQWRPLQSPSSTACCDGLHHYGLPQGNLGCPL